MVGGVPTTTAIRIRRKRVQTWSQENQRSWDAKEWQRGSHSCGGRGVSGKQKQLARSVSFSEECKDTSLFGEMVCDWEEMEPPASRGPWK